MKVGSLILVGALLSVSAVSQISEAQVPRRYSVAKIDTGAPLPNPTYPDQPVERFPNMIGNNGHVGGYASYFDFTNPLIITRTLDSVLWVKPTTRVSLRQRREGFFLTSNITSNGLMLGQNSNEVAQNPFSSEPWVAIPNSTSALDHQFSYRKLRMPALDPDNDRLLLAFGLSSRGAVAGTIFTNIHAGSIQMPLIWSSPDAAPKGSGPLTYQWLRNNIGIIGATGAQLSLANVTYAMSGSYSVQITNTLNGLTVLSNQAELTVNQPAPTGISAEYLASLSRVRVAWEGASGATLYRVFRSSSSAMPCPSGADTFTTTAIAINDTTAIPGVLYRYSIQAEAGAATACSAISVPGMRAVAALQGLIRDTNNNPLAGVAVTVPGLTTVITGSNGTYLINFGGLGTITIVPALNGYSFLPTQVVVSLSTGNNTGNNFTGITSSSSSVSSSASSTSQSSSLSSSAASSSSSSSVSSSSSSSSSSSVISSSVGSSSLNSSISSASSVSSASSSSTSSSTSSVSSSASSSSESSSSSNSSVNPISTISSSSSSTCMPVEVEHAKSVTKSSAVTLKNSPASSLRAINARAYRVSKSLKAKLQRQGRTQRKELDVQYVELSAVIDSIPSVVFNCVNSCSDIETLSVGVARSKVIEMHSSSISYLKKVSRHAFKGNKKLLNKFMVKTRKLLDLARQRAESELSYIAGLTGQCINSN